MHEQFKITYFEECEDRILEAEEGFSQMLEGNRDSDVIDTVFRSIHSIKGGAGAFGFDRVVDFTHHFETVLDFVRTGEIVPDRDMCGLFLRAHDIVADMIAKEKASEPIAENFGAEVLVELRKLSLADEDNTDGTEHVDYLDATDAGAERTWSIIFRPYPDILKTGNEPLFIIRALKELGELQVTAECDDIPSLDNMSPEQCYIGWRMLLKTAAAEEEVWEIFDFVEGLCELTIEQQNVPPGDMAERRKTGNEGSSTREARRKEDRDLDESSSAPVKEVTSASAMSPVAQSIRVDLDRIDQLVNLVGEMVIAQSMLQEQVRWLPYEVSNTISVGVENLSRHMRDLQESVMSVRAQPIKSVFTRMPRIIREVSATCGKDVRLTTFGEETEVDKTVLENLIDPLTHMIRNSIDHGIETPEERSANGKTPYGTIQLSAKHKSGRIVIEIEDDGAGINRDAVLKKAKQQGLVNDDQVLSSNEIDNLVFKAGFSTAEKVSEVSGRGVGMDVVKRNISNLGGRIHVASYPGEGCTVTMSLPLTLAVMDGMVVSVGSERFVLPTINIIESFRPNAGAIERLTQDVCVIRARGEYVRIIALHSLFEIDDARTAPEEALVILLESDDGERLAVMVDDVLGQQQVVIKSLERNYNNVQGISAATILGNGDVALIIDVPGLHDMNASINLEAERLNVIMPEESSGEGSDADSEANDDLAESNQEEIQETVLEGQCDE